MKMPARRFTTYTKSERIVKIGRKKIEATFHPKLIIEVPISLQVHIYILIRTLSSQEEAYIHLTCK